MKKLLFVIVFSLFSLVSFTQTIEGDYSQTDPDQTAFMYNDTRYDSVPPGIMDSLRVAVRELKEAVSELIDVTIGRTNTYQGMVKDAKKLLRKIENSKLVEDAKNTETIKGIKKDLAELQRMLNNK